MKRFTLWTLALLVSVVAFAQKPKAMMEGKLMKALPTEIAINANNIKMAPAALQNKMKKRAAAKRAGLVDELVGDYLWEYKQANETAIDPKTIETTSGSAYVKISASTEDENTIILSGMFPEDITATVDSDDEYGDYIEIKGGQAAGTSSYGDYVLYGLFYYEGDEEDQAGWYYSNIYGYILRGGIISFDGEWFARVLKGQYEGYTLTPYWVVGSTMTPAEAPKVVEVPEGIIAEEYVMSYDDDGEQAAIPVKVAVDGNDVYFQGLSYYIPEAWVKGTKEGNTVTFPEMQYLGEYGSYGSSYAFYNGPAVFTYDATADTYSATGTIFGVLADQYYDGYYTDPVLTKVVEVAAMPANPIITALKNGNYGWYINFNVPLQDVNGNALLSSKLSYQFYTDIAGNIAPLTFTSATHSRLTEDMTIIPYGFTENYDFYDDAIYLNGLESTDWNKLGIKSIYTGGGVTNETEIQWYEIDWITLGINDVKNTKVNNSAIYNMSGQRVSNNYKGLVIKNGKKYIAK